MYCPNCGAQMPDNVDFCSNCGAHIGTTINTDNNQTYVSSTAKSKLSAGLLAIFLGAFGVHFYYLDENEKFKKRLILGLLGFVTCGITTMVAGILGIVEGIQILTDKITVDGNGVPLAD